MSGYWEKRWADMLAKADEAPTPGLRAVYLQLADHYRSLHDREAAKLVRPR